MKNCLNFSSDSRTHLVKNMREKLVVWAGFGQKRNRGVIWQKYLDLAAIL